jgi:hypothetical protein
MPTESPAMLIATPLDYRRFVATAIRQNSWVVFGQRMVVGGTFCRSQKKHVRFGSIALQKSKVAAPRIFAKKPERESIADSHKLRLLQHNPPESRHETETARCQRCAKRHQIARQRTRELRCSANRRSHARPTGGLDIDALRKLNALRHTLQHKSAPPE